MYKCNSCGDVCHEPQVYRYKEPMPDGFYEPWAVNICPWCGSDELEEIDDIENESEDMNDGNEQDRSG